MESTNKENAVCVLTARGIETMLAEGGSQAWVLDAKRARKCEYVICVQNRALNDDWGTATAPHHAAFLVGRLKDVARSTESGCEFRWILRFSEYAEINVADAWPGNRNPILYTDLASFGIDVDTLKFNPMPVIEAPHNVVKPASPSAKPMTLAEAKEGLAAAFGVTPADIEITVRG